MTITINLSEKAIRFLREKAEATSRPLEAYVEQELERLAIGSEDPLIGIFADDAELLDQIEADIMWNRENQSWRAPAGGETAS